MWLWQQSGRGLSHYNKLCIAMVAQLQCVVFLIHVGTSNNSFIYGHRVHMKYSSRTSSMYLSTARWRVGL